MPKRFSLIPFTIQASLQNVKQGSTHWFQLCVIYQNGTLEPRLFDGQHQSPQPWWLLRRQWELQFNHEWTPEWARFTTALSFCPRACREWPCQEIIWRLLQYHRWRFADQVWIHAELHAQKTVFGVWWHCVRVPLWGGFMWGLQGFLQENNSRSVAFLGWEKQNQNILFHPDFPVLKQFCYILSFLLLCSSRIWW